MISIKNLTVQFSKNVVLDNISIDFPSNRIYGVVGLNGAGKTTFFNSLSTNLKIDSGSITVHSQLINSRDIAYLETNNFFYSRLTGEEYLNIFQQTNPDFNLDTLQEFMQLPLDELIESYSTGMKKKLALLGILKQKRSIFLLDEPFNGLDLETNKILELIIVTLKTKNKTVFLSSHIIDPLLTVCDEIHFLEHGKFTKKFEKADFNKIEDELFRKLKTAAQQKITNAI
ncbi:MAG TPA: ATP-binding cassette domain-containing protein [Bacteroidia bacterium]|jgi:ABC-2 type transport system ATP-binding protein|nr:ATP-binding cassette domain-containing protein [Bacteroidia bacterium]